MLTFRQMDSIVHNTLLVFNNIDIARRVEGTNVFYDVYYKNNKEKLGTYRVWEWYDGSGRSGWVNSDNKTPEIEKHKHTIWETIMAIAVPANQETENTHVKKPQDPPKPPEPKTSGGKIEIWLDWYHAMLDNGYKCTLEEVANKSGYSLGYIKQKHMVYQEKSNQNT